MAGKEQLGFEFQEVSREWHSPSPLKVSGRTAETRQTSRDAAEKALPRSGTDRARILEFIRSRGEFGATDREMQDALAMDGNTQRPRRIELLERELIKQAGTRPNAKGRPMVVWVVENHQSQGWDAGSHP